MFSNLAGAGLFAIDGVIEQAPQVSYSDASSIEEGVRAIYRDIVHLEANEDTVQRWAAQIRGGELTLEQLADYQREHTPGVAPAPASTPAVNPAVPNIVTDRVLDPVPQPALPSTPAPSSSSIAPPGAASPTVLPGTSPTLTAESKKSAWWVLAIGAAVLFAVIYFVARKR